MQLGWSEFPRGVLVLTNPDADPAAIRQRVTEMVSQHWNATGHALLMSALGSQLRREFPDSAWLVRAGLKSFVMAYPIAQFVSHPEIGEKTGLVPLGVKLPADLRTLFGPKSEGSRQPRYFPHFWKAFVNPISGRRFVIIDGNPIPQVVDLPDPPPGVTVHEIFPQELVQIQPSATVGEKVTATISKIKSWLARTRLDESIFIINKTPPAPVAHHSRQEPLNQSESATALAELLAGLNETDQSRIAIPLDIVLKLISKK